MWDENMVWHQKPQRLMFPRLDVTNFEKISHLESLYEDGHISRSQQYKMQALAASQAAYSFAISQWGQVRVFSASTVWVLDNAGRVVFQARRPQ